MTNSQLILSATVALMLIGGCARESENDRGGDPFAVLTAPPQVTNLTPVQLSFPYPSPPQTNAIPRNNKLWVQARDAVRGTAPPICLHWLGITDEGDPGQTYYICSTGLVRKIADFRHDRFAAGGGVQEKTSTNFSVGYFDGSSFVPVHDDPPKGKMLVPSPAIVWRRPTR